jgi:hypothetical protein
MRQADLLAARNDIDLMVNVILGGTAFKPHREAAERVRAALATPSTLASRDVDAACAYECPFTEDGHHIGMADHEFLSVSPATQAADDR